ncbi:unnamed protein product [Allacma fusca]|uniref:Uncharacterized protein n=1 Tax=Allacma fusca TaxID=39272 RepID=A0A8J2NT64_9HEXA|nr:unnamed protein product [Allacma fusca]
MSSGTDQDKEEMFPIIRHVGFIDILVSLCLISYVSIGYYKNDDSRFQSLSGNRGSVDERRHVFYLLSHFLLILRLIAAVVLFGASFKEEFRKQFNACILWIFIALVTLIILSVQLCVCFLSFVEMIVIGLEILFRIFCAVFIIAYMRSEKGINSWTE